MKHIWKTLVLTGLVTILAAALLSASGTGRDATLHFDHILHYEDNGMACEDCHADVIGQTSSAERSMPDHDVCSMCHDTDDDCAMCHVDGDPVAWPDVEGMYEGFAHSAHDGVDCLTCHGNVSEHEPVVPSMASCQECHVDDNGPLDCEACHEGERPEPHDHELATWHVDHGLEASMRGNDCNMCHTQDSCDECHQGENLYGTPHPPTWEFNHGIEANWSGECMVCHETRQTCTECHRSTLPVPHPFGLEYANLTDGGDHVEEATSFIEACLACHDVGESDPTCARCHE